MSKSKRAWFVASVIVAVAALVDGSIGLAGSSVTRPAGVLVIAIGLMPVAFLLAGSVDRRRMVGALHVGAGVLLGLAGFVLASQDGFLRLKLALIGWRLLVISGPSLAPVGLMTVGVALILMGTGLLLLWRSLAVLSSLLVILTSGFFSGSLTLVPYLRFRHLGHNVVDPQAIAAAVVMLLAALLLVTAALSRYPVRWVPPVTERPGNVTGWADDSAHPNELPSSHLRRRRVKAVAWSAVGAAVVAGIWGWASLTFGPRIVLAEVFPDPNLAACVAQAMGVSGPSAKVSQNAMTQVRSLPCSDYRTKEYSRSPQPSGTLRDSPPPTRPHPGFVTTNIRSLRGLDRLTNLASLGVRSNEITDLTPLANLHKLGTVTLTNNRVTDLTPLAGLPALSDLGLSGNAVTDLTPLAHVRTLRLLGLNQNQISDLAPLAGLPTLDTLDASGNQISDVTPLAHLPQLRRLTLSGNQIVSAAPLREMPALSMLNISQNRVADARTFAGFVTLEELWAGGNLLTDVTPLAALPALTGVDFEGTMSSTLVGLDALRARKIYVGGFA
jgi:internalin A